MAVHVLDDLVTIERGDVVMVGTSAGTTAGPVEIAIVARERGAGIVVLTQLELNATFGCPSATAADNVSTNSRMSWWIWAVPSATANSSLGTAGAYPPRAPELPECSRCG